MQLSSQFLIFACTLIFIGYLNTCTSNDEIDFGEEISPKIWPNVSANGSFMKLPGLSGSGGLDFSTYDLFAGIVNKTRFLPSLVTQAGNYTLLQFAIMATVGGLLTGAAALLAEAHFFKLYYGDLIHDGFYGSPGVGVGGGGSSYGVPTYGAPPAPAYGPPPAPAYGPPPAPVYGPPPAPAYGPPPAPYGPPPAPVYGSPPPPNYSPPATAYGAPPPVSEYSPPSTYSDNNPSLSHNSPDSSYGSPDPSPPSSYDQSSSSNLLPSPISSYTSSDSNYAVPSPSAYNTYGVPSKRVGKPKS